MEQFVLFDNFLFLTLTISHFSTHINACTGLKAGVAVCVRFLQDAFPALHNALFGSFSAAHPKIDPARDVMISWTSHSVLSLTPEGAFTHVLSFYHRLC